MENATLNQLLTTKKNLPNELIRNSNQLERGFDMIGKIRSEQQCPICGGEFRDNGKQLICPEHLTSPVSSYYVFWYYKGRYRRWGFKSYSECINFLVEVTNKINEKRFDPRDYQTKTSKYFRFDYFIDKWIASQKKRVEKQNLSPGYFQHMKHYIDLYRAHFNTEDIREVFKTHRIKDFYESLPDNISLTTQSHIMSLLHKIMNDAYNDELITRKPIFPAITVPEPDTPWLDTERQQAILDNIPPHHQPIIYFMMRYGVRTGEARALQWQDIDFERKEIVIRRAFSKTVLRQFTKTKRQRRLPLFDDIEELLSHIPKGLRCDFVFTVQGHAYGENRAGKIWRKARALVNENNINLKSGTRHSIGSQLGNNGTTLNVIAELLGHSDIRTTRRYTHIGIATLRNVMGEERGRPTQNRHTFVGVKSR
jgi:integrase